MIYYTRQVSQDDIEGIGNILNILSTAFLRGSGAFDTPPVSRSTTGNSNMSRSTTGDSFKFGGKKYRKRKNKTKRRNKKTKRRNNRKSKRR